ncbi:hypothetical protein NMG60_11008837 [Bertholletia excelsa]
MGPLYPSLYKSLGFVDFSGTNLPVIYTAELSRQVMAMRSFVSRTSVGNFMEGKRGSAISGLRYFSEGKGRVLSEEERAAENVYIQKMERERMEKLKQKSEKEKAEKEQGEKKAEDPHKS